MYYGHILGISSSIYHNFSLFLTGLFPPGHIICQAFLSPIELTLPVQVPGTYLTFFAKAHFQIWILYLQCFFYLQLSRIVLRSPERDVTSRSTHTSVSFFPGCGSGSVSGSGLDPDSIGSVDPDPYSESGSGSRRAKMTHKSRNFFEKFMFWSVGWPLLRAEGFFCNLDFLYGGLGIGKL